MSDEMQDVKKEAKLDEIKDAYEQVMKMPEGRLLLGSILEMGGFFHNTFNVDSHANAHNSGMNTIASQVWFEMGNASPENRIKMLQEVDHG